METDRKDPLTPTLDTSNQNVGSFGNRLKQARINKNLTLDDVAAELFILRRHLEAIEAEDFRSLPQIAFARGFVINYAKYRHGRDPQGDGTVVRTFIITGITSFCKAFLNLP